MKVFEVELSQEAHAHILLIDTWWCSNRPSAPLLFREELAAALARLHAFPHAGSLYPASPEPQTRRLLMPRTQYHLHYVIREEKARVLVQKICVLGLSSGCRTPRRPIPRYAPTVPPATEVRNGIEGNFSRALLSERRRSEQHEDCERTGSSRPPGWS